MNITANRVRGLSVALLLGALLNHGIVRGPNIGAGQGTGGLLRLARDLTRRTGGIIDGEQQVAAQIIWVRATSKGDRF